MNWFGKKKTSEASTVSAKSARPTSNPQGTIVALRENIQNQEKRQDFINKKIDDLVKEAKMKMSKGDKKGALFAMKRKKLYEGEVDKIENVKMTLETQVINLESAAQNAETYKAMMAGTSTMKKIRTDVGLEDVDNVMDNIKEEMDLANEINSAIAQPVDPLFADDDELLAELNELETMDLEAELLKPAPTPISLPNVPASKLPAIAKAEEDELKMLERELAGM